MSVRCSPIPSRHPSSPSPPLGEIPKPTHPVVLTFTANAIVRSTLPESPVEHVRISIPVVEGWTECVPTGEVTQNEGQQNQQTQQRPHCGNRSPSRMKSLGISLIYTFCAPAPRSLPASHTPLRFEWPHSHEPILPRTPCYRSLVPMLFPYKTHVMWSDKSLLAMLCEGTLPNYFIKKLASLWR